MANNSQTSMSPYEEKAWRELREQALRRQRRQVLNQETRQRLTSAARKAGERLRDIPGVANAQQVLQEAMDGLRGLTMDAAMMSVSEQAVLDRFQAQGVTPASFSDLRSFDLEVCDLAIPRLRTRYTTAAAGEGALTSLAITGMEVQDKVKGGPKMAAVGGAIVADTGFVLAAMGRCIAETGAYYGFDVSQEEEQLFALAIIAYSTASTRVGKVAAMAELSKLTQMMMRHATWEVLSKEPMVKIIQHIYARLGIRLTKKGLGKVVPVAGVAIGSGLNAAALDRVGRDAKMAYRIRFLATKYDLDPSVMVDDKYADESGDADTIEIGLPSDYASGGDEYGDSADQA